MTGTKLKSLRAAWETFNDTVWLLSVGFWVFLFSFMLRPIETTRSVVALARGDYDAGPALDTRDLDWIDEWELERKRKRNDR